MFWFLFWFSFPAAAERRSLARSPRLPAYCPITAAATVNRIASFGIPTALRKLATNGIDACIATNHWKENFSVCSRSAPRGALTNAAVAATARSLLCNGSGRSRFTWGSAATAARIATIGAGHLNGRSAAVNIDFTSASNPGTFANGHLDAANDFTEASTDAEAAEVDAVDDFEAGGALFFAEADEPPSAVFFDARASSPFPPPPPDGFRHPPPPPPPPTRPSAEKEMDATRRASAPRKLHASLLAGAAASSSSSSPDRDRGVDVVAKRPRSGHRARGVGVAGAAADSIAS